LPRESRERLMSHIENDSSNITVVQRVTPPCGWSDVAIATWLHNELRVSRRLKIKPALILPRDFQRRL
jgi:hypothetical protein